VRGYDDGGAAGARRLLLRGRKAEAKQMGARDGSGRRWRDEGALRRVVACAVRALATRGRRRGHAAFALCRWSAIEANVPDLIQFVRNTMAA